MTWNTHSPRGGYWAPGAAEYGPSSSSSPSSSGGLAKLEAPGRNPGYHRMDAPPPMPRPQTDWPPIDEGVVAPESNTEYFKGEVRECMPANPEHSVQHMRVSAVLNAHRTEGYVVDIDLLTRQDEENAFASDCCLRRDGIDDTTGKRYLEEVAFEIKATQKTKDLTERAELMAARGIRRIFAIPVKGDQAAGTMVAGPLMEWQHSIADWRILSRDETITDPTLGQDIPVSALLDAAQADQSVAKAVLASNHPVVAENNQAFYQDGYQAGRNDERIETLRETLLLLLQAHGFDPAQAREPIDACTDAQKLKRWITRTTNASSLRDVIH